MSTILKDTISFFFRNIFDIVFVVLPIALLQILIDFSLGYVLYANNLQSAPHLFSSSFTDLLFSPIYTGALIFLFSKILTGEKWTLKESLKTSLRFYPYLFVIRLIYNFSISVGLFFCIIPGLIFAARFSIAGFFVVLEGYKPNLALKQSWALSKNYTWTFIGSICVFSIPLILAIFFYQPLSILLRKGILISALFDFIITIYKSAFIALFFRFFCLISSKETTESDAIGKKIDNGKLDELNISRSWLSNKIVRISNEIKRRKFKIFLDGFTSRKQAIFFIFLLWWLSSLTSGEFLMLPFISMSTLFFGPIAIAFIIQFFPANIFVNLGIIPDMDSFNDLSLAWFYIIIYWCLFIILHYLTISRRKYIYLLLLAIFLILTAHSCAERMPSFQ